MKIVKPQIENYENYSHKNDCTVVALSASTGISYDRAFNFLELCGRKHKRGFNSSKMIEEYNSRNGNVFEHVVKSKKIIVRKFVKMFPKGTFYVRKRGHAFVVKDGVVVEMHDGAVTPRSFIQDAWQFKKEVALSF